MTHNAGEQSDLGLLEIDRAVARERSECLAIAMREAEHRNEPPEGLSTDELVVFRRLNDAACMRAATIAIAIQCRENPSISKP